MQNTKNFKTWFFVIIFLTFIFTIGGNSSNSKIKVDAQSQGSSLFLSPFLFAKNLELITNPSVANANVKATYYSAIGNQRISGKLITSSGQKLQLNEIQSARYLAMSKDLLCQTCRKLTWSIKTQRYQHQHDSTKYCYGDQIFISGAADELNGRWQIEDTMADSMRYRIDFLVPLNHKHRDGVWNVKIKLEKRFQ